MVHEGPKLHFVVSGVSDAGVYSCKATNFVGETKHLDFSIEIEPTLHRDTSSKAFFKNASIKYFNTSNISDVFPQHSLDLVTEAGPQNGTVLEGSNADIWCKIRTTKTSAIAPFVQWMKRVRDEPSASSAFIISVGKEKFRIIEEKPTSRLQILTNYSEKNSLMFSSHLKIRNSRKEDAGLYVCFVTDNGQLSYKSVRLNVHTVLVDPESKLRSWLLTSVIIASAGILTTLGLMVALCMVCKTHHYLPPDVKTFSSTPDLLRESSGTTTTTMAYPSLSSQWTSTVFPDPHYETTHDSFLSTFKYDKNLYEVPYAKRSYSLDNTLDIDQLPPPPSTLRPNDAQKMIYSKSCFTIEDGYQEPQKIFVSVPYNV